MKKLLVVFAAAIVLAAGCSVVLTARYASTQASVTPAPEIAVPAGAAERLLGDDIRRVPLVNPQQARGHVREWAFRPAHGPAVIQL